MIRLPETNVRVGYRLKAARIDVALAAFPRYFEMPSICSVVRNRL